MEASRRGASPTRPAEVRPVSRTRRMWRSRSGRQVRTATVVWRAVARQSMERVSSPGTYSRRLSNSVPSPRVRTLVRPSSSRRRASFEGRCLRLVNGGRTRTVQGTWWVPWREKRPRGPYERIVTRSAWRSPRRVGRRRVVTRRRSPAGTVRRWREAVTSVPGCQLLGGQASRSVGAERAAGRVGDGEGDVGGFAEADGGVAGAGQAEASYGCRQGEVAGTGHGQGGVDREDARPAGVPDADGEGAQGREEGGASGECHQRGTGTWARIALMTESAVTPSISASGRSCTRWRRVGRARALTSSGMT